jgi:chromosome segregation ATPase
MPVITMVDSKDLEDKRVQKIDADISNFKTDLQAAETELAGLDNRLDAEIETYRKMAKSRMDDYEAVRTHLREAERFWKEADKKYRDAKRQKEKTRSTLKKKVETLRRRIRNAETAKDDRFREMGKSKRKLTGNSRIDS